MFIGEQPPKLCTYKLLIQSPDVLPVNLNGDKSILIPTPSFLLNINVFPFTVPPVV